MFTSHQRRQGRWIKPTTESWSRSKAIRSPEDLGAGRLRLRSGQGKNHCLVPSPSDHARRLSRSFCPQKCRHCPDSAPIFRSITSNHELLAWSDPFSAVSQFAWSDPIPHVWLASPTVCLASPLPGGGGGEDYIAKICAEDGVQLAHLRSSARGAAVSRCRSKAAWDLVAEMGLLLAEPARRVRVCTSAIWHAIGRAKGLQVSEYRMSPFPQKHRRFLASTTRTPLAASGDFLRAHTR
jgi:hypothetical protein